MEILKFRKGDIIFEEGDLEDWMYEIRKGMVGIYAGYGTPEEKELTALEEGSFLGELGLITGSERSAAAAALENTELLKITDEELAEYFVANPGKIIRVMKQMAARLQDLTDDYMEACRTISEMDHYDADADEEVLSLAGLCLKDARKVFLNESGDFILSCCFHAVCFELFTKEVISCE